MELKDIIRNDYDRLFILDPECFVIFTGEDLDDERPFIRLGNWADLPVELIPLIENIIITDGITGNPSLEQFNIDITSLSENRYIGSENIITSYLEFQKVFGLDLTNATIVNVEKDIPELSQEKSISGKNQFTGVFYRNGNFKTVHCDNEIINLFDVEDESPRPITLLEKVRANCRNSTRYRGIGLFILSHNPVFYSRDIFYSYLMPALPTAEMRSLGINPGNIRHIFFPSSNYINIPPFMKWLHNREGKLSVYSDRPEDWDRIKKIFPRAGLNLLPFCDMKVQTDERISIENISRSFNLKVTMTDASGGKINLAYLKGTGQAREILKEHLDGVLVPYSVFEDITLLFKSSGTPVAIIDDGNPRVSRVPILDHIVLFRGIQYEIQCSCDQSFLASLLLPEGTDCEKIAQKDLSSINDIFSRDNSNRDFQVRLFNLLSVVRMFLFGTTDRAYASELKKLCQDLMACINSTVVELAGEQYRVLLLFSNKTIIQFLQPLPADEHGIQDYSSPSFEKRIAEDRERLLLLLKLLMGRESRHKSAAHVDELVTAIQTRKELYRDNGMPGYEGYPSSIPDSEKTHVPGLSIAEEKLRGLNLRQKILAPGKRKYLAGVSLFCTILLALAITMLLRPDKKNKVPGPPATVAATVEDKRIIDKFAITVTDTDIYEYANQVARKNGYSPISMTDLKRMNPNWIYPSNVFILLDGEKIVVQKGDTLWDLAHSKLLRLNIEFFRVLERLEKSPENEWPGIISEAERYALTGRNRRILAEKKGTLLNGAKR